MSKETIMPKKSTVNLARLEELMKRKDWGIGELAQYSGVNYDTVYSIVKGRRPTPGVAIVKKLAAALGTSIEDLLGEGQAPPRAETPVAILRLTDIAGRLSEVRQEELLQIAATLEKLEREQATQPLPSGTMRELLQVAEILRERGGNEDLLGLLEALLRR